MRAFFFDLQYAVRMLRKSRGTALLAMVALALGIGANTAVFSLVNAVLLRPLPFADADRLMIVRQNFRQLGLSGIPVSPAEFTDYRERGNSFSHLAAYQVLTVNRTGVDMPEQIPAARVSPSLFSLLRTAPALGRSFLPEEEQPGRHHAVILGHGLWQRRFGGDAAILGKTLTLDGNAFLIVGVMPARFQFPIQTVPVEMWTPLAFTAEEMNRRGARNLGMIGRLREEASREQAEAELTAIAQGFPGLPAPLGLEVTPLRETVVRGVRAALLILLDAVGFVLLIACANVANLLLARAATRQKEVAIRLAMGATRVRLMRQFLTESLLLSVSGGVAGVLFAAWSGHLLLKLSPSGVPRFHDAGIDGNVLLFSVLLSVLTGVLFGLAPALQASKPDLNEALKQEGRGGIHGFRLLSLRNALVVAETGLALVLLIGAGLLANSFVRLIGIDPGFDPRNVVTMRLSPSQARYPEREQRSAFFHQVLSRASVLPGVEAAAITNVLPLAGGTDYGFTIAGRPLKDLLTAEWRAVSPDYFRAMRIPIRRGRVFDDRDSTNSAGVVIVNEAMAARFWPNENLIGQRIKLGGSDSPQPPLAIVGIVGDVRQSGLHELPKPEMYVPYTQLPQVPVEFLRFPPMTLVLRTAHGAAGMAAAVRQEILALDKDLPVPAAGSMEEILSGWLAQRRFNMLLLGAFAGLALLLAALGIYGVMSYSVAQRTQEIGIRLALGAERRDVFRMVLRQGLAVALIGIGLGLAASFGLTQVLANLLYGIRPTDPPTFLAVAAFLTAVTLAACYVPAQRATAVDPMVALRAAVDTPWSLPRSLRLRAIRDDAERAMTYDERQVLSDLGHAARTVSHVEELFDVIARRLQQTLGVESLSLFLREDKSGDYRIAASCPDREVRASLASDAFVVRRLKSLSMPMAIEEKDFETWMRALAEADPEGLEARGREIGTLQRVRASLLLQIALKDQLIGILALGPRKYSQQDKEMLMLVGGQIAFIVENAKLARRVAEQERLNRELEIAEEVQRRLFPERPPQIPGFDLTGYCRPARGVGGDYYDFLQLDRGQLGIALADVAGKGIAAALLMSLVQASLRSLVTADESAVAQLATKMNALLYRSTGPSSYATFFYAQLDAASLRMTYVNAGHCPPLLVRRSGIQELTVGGPVIGLLPNCFYEHGSIQLQAGDLLVAFSDGVSEAMSPNDEEFGEERLRQLLSDLPDAAAREVEASLLRHLEEWCAGAPQHDDLTFLVMRAG
ncbi:MAG: ADOP family duplicated permease [Bryobacteraceae bacterium]